MLYIGDEVEVTIRGKITMIRESERPEGRKCEIVSKNNESAYAYMRNIKLIKKGVEHDRDRKYNQNA